jgi:hypothetical protein
MKQTCIANSTQTLDEGLAPLRDVTVHEIYLLIAIILHMGHDQRDTMKDYWSTAENFLWQYNKTRWIFPHTEISAFQ